MSFLEPIDSYFLRESSPKRSASPSAGDDVETSSRSLGSSHKEITVANIKPGFDHIHFTGRVISFDNHPNKSKSPGGAHSVLRIAVSDGTAAVEVKLWISKNFTFNSTKIQLGTLVVVHATVVHPLSPKANEDSPSTNMCYIQGSRHSSGITIKVIEETEENHANYRTPLGCIGMDIVPDSMPLRAYVEGGGDRPGQRLLVAIKWKRAKGSIVLKDGSVLEKREIGIFDPSAGATLTVWGPTCASTVSWNIAETVLLITSPSIKRYKNDVSLSLGHISLVDIDPSTRDAQELRTYAKKELGMAKTGSQGDFDWPDGNGERVHFTLHDLDRYSREPQKQAVYLDCVGFLPVIITEINAFNLYQKNMLYHGSCCGFAVYSNALMRTVCQHCGENVADLELNPTLIGRISDETGSLSGNQILWSRRAWEQIFKLAFEKISWLSAKELLVLDEYILFTRMKLIFGWKAEQRRIVVREIFER